MKMFFKSFLIKAMKGKIIHIEGMKFLGIIDNHSIVFDNGEAALTPMQTLLLSLAACTAMDVWNIMVKKREKINRLEIEIEGERENKYPKIFKKIELKYIFKGEVNEKACEQAIELSMKKYCSISNMIKEVAEIKTSFEVK